MLDFSEAESGYQYDYLVDHLRAQAERVLLLNWKIARVTLGVNHPYWIQDLDFDISHHVRRISCPAPGNKQAFCLLVSELYAQNLVYPLDYAIICQGLDFTGCHAQQFTIHIFIVLAVAWGASVNPTASIGGTFAQLNGHFSDWPCANFSTGNFS